MFIKITYCQTTEAASESIAAAGGRGTCSEIERHINETRFRQRVRMSNAAQHIDGMWRQGYRVEAINPCAPPLA